MAKTIRTAWLAGALALASAGAAAGEWPFYQGNVEHSGYVPDVLSGLPATADPVWRVQAQVWPLSGLAVSNGRVLTTPYVYFAQNSTIVSQRITDGSVEWSHDFGSIYSVNQPAVDAGVVYIQTSDNGGATFLHAYAVDGTFLWRSPFDSQWERYLGPIVVHGQIYFDGGTYGGIYGMSTADGSETFYQSLPQYDSWSPTWHDNMLLAYTDELDAITPDTGLVLYTITDPAYVWNGYSPDQAPVVVGNLAYVTNGGRLVAFDLQAHDIAWARDIDATGQVSTDGNEVFVVAGGALSVRDPATGDLLWSWVPTASGSATTRIVVTPSHVILGDDTNTYLVNRTTHQTDTTLAATGLIAYAENMILIGDSTGYVSAFRLPQDAIFANGFDY